jgi:hypothetical protein
MDEPTQQQTQEEELHELPERPLFPHPDWSVGVVLILGVVAIVAGTRNPVWWLIGSPLILALVIYLWVRIRGLGRRD